MNPQVIGFCSFAFYSFVLVTALFFQWLSDCRALLTSMQSVNRGDQEMYEPGMLTRSSLYEF